MGISKVQKCIGFINEFAVEADKIYSISNIDALNQGLEIFEDKCQVFFQLSFTNHKVMLPILFFDPSEKNIQAIERTMELFNLTYEEVNFRFIRSKLITE